MRLKSLSFEDKRTGWKLEDLRLGGFNLLVGISGVGKTKILGAIRLVIGVAQGDSVPPDVRFDFRFEHEEQDYRWQLDSTAQPAANGHSQSALILLESLVRGDAALVERSRDKFTFLAKESPLLNRSESAFKLLDDPAIQKLRRAFTHQTLLNSADWHLNVQVEARHYSAILDDETLTFEAFRAHTDLPTPVKAFILQTRFPEQFKAYKSDFISIFPSVEDIQILRRSLDSFAHNSPGIALEFRLKEQGVASWIESLEISAGMARVLALLLGLRLAQPGSVILIDEFENSLGVNCMGPVTDFLISREHELQFIITSHHPYIINNIPKDYWKLVRRHGSTVRVTPASEVRALQGASSLDDFFRLINAREFEEGIQ